MIIALSQQNYIIADLVFNRTKIIDSINEARLAGVDLIVFSELNVCGYPPQDLLEQQDFISNIEESISIIADNCKGIAAIIGAPVINHSQKGKKLFNSAIFIDDGIIKHKQFKTHLPTYDIFDEYRYLNITLSLM